MLLDPKISHVTRHQGPGVVYQLHHFAGRMLHDVTKPCGKVFMELKDGGTRFTNGCPFKVAKMPEIKPEESATEPVDAPLPVAELPVVAPLKPKVKATLALAEAAKS